MHQDVYSGAMLAFCILGLLIVYFDLGELYTAWYSGMYPAMSFSGWLVMTFRIGFVLAAVLMVLNNLIQSGFGQPPNQKEPKSKIEVTETTEISHSYCRNESTSGCLVTVEIGMASLSLHPDDQYREVWLTLADGRIFFTVFFSDPQRRNKHWFEDPHMSIVNDLSIDNIVKAVNDFLDSGDLENAFEQVG